jgi:hypothetical protein
MLGMSIFDVIGAIAWGLTTAPIPMYSKYGTPSSIYGSIGNNASCKAQGFFIQLNFTSIFYNITLSTYYLLGKKMAGRKCIDRLNRVEKLCTNGYVLNSLVFKSHCEGLAGTTTEKKPMVVARSAHHNRVCTCLRRAIILQNHGLWVSYRNPSCP